MFVLSTRAHERIVLPDNETSIEVVSIQSGSVRLAIRSAEEVRVIQEGPSASATATWRPTELADNEAPTLPMLKKMLEKRLEIAREGIHEANEKLRAGLDEDARMLLEKVDEDLHLLRRRIRREFEKAETLTCGV